MSKESPWERYKKNLGDTRPWDLLNSDSPRASDEVAYERYNSCLSCPQLIQTTKQCKKCGCFMNLKVKLEHAACPLNKW